MDNNPNQGRCETLLAAAKEARERADGYKYGNGMEGYAALMGMARWLESEAEVAEVLLRKSPQEQSKCSPL